MNFLYTKDLKIRHAFRAQIEIKANKSLQFKVPQVAVGITHINFLSKEKTTKQNRNLKTTAMVIISRDSSYFCSPLLVITILLQYFEEPLSLTFPKWRKIFSMRCHELQSIKIN